MYCMDSDMSSHFLLLVTSVINSIQVFIEDAELALQCDSHSSVTQHCVIANKLVLPIPVPLPPPIYSRKQPLSVALPPLPSTVQLSSSHAPTLARTLQGRMAQTVDLIGCVGANRCPAYVRCYAAYNKQNTVKSDLIMTEMLAFP